MTVAPNRNASVAQLDRASDFGSEGWGFESLPMHHQPKMNRVDAGSGGANMARERNVQTSGPRGGEVMLDWRRTGAGGAELCQAVRDSRPNFQTGGPGAMAAILFPAAVARNGG